MCDRNNLCRRGRAWIELNMENLAENVRQFQRILPEHCKLMPAIKANAYGHGAVLIGKALSELGIHDYCVASVCEAVELREAGITGQILVLGYTSPCQFHDLAEYSLTQTVVDLAYAKQLNDYGYPLCVHVGIDTGMHRLGERSEDIENICEIWKLKHLKITGVYSHLCASDGLSKKERAFTRKQIAEFRSVVEALHRRGISGFQTHLQGSYGVLNYPELQFDYARVGIALYGALSTPGDRIDTDIDLKPVLSLKARIVCVKTLHEKEPVGYGLSYTAEKEMKIAVVSIGYADGIPRELSNKGYALVNGCRAEVIGRVCMDQLLLDVSGITDVTAGDEAVFIGKSEMCTDGRRISVGKPGASAENRRVCVKKNGKGSEAEIRAEEVAEIAGTISNEILSRLGNRLERVDSGSYNHK